MCQEYLEYIMFTLYSVQVSDEVKNTRNFERERQD